MVFTHHITLSTKEEGWKRCSILLSSLLDNGRPVFQINFERQAKDVAFICPWIKPLHSWWKLYFLSLNVQVKVISWQVKHLATSSRESSPSSTIFCCEHLSLIFLSIFLLPFLDLLAFSFPFLPELWVFS